MSAGEIRTCALQCDLREMARAGSEGAASTDRDCQVQALAPFVSDASRKWAAIKASKMVAFHPSKDLKARGIAAL